MAVTNLVDRDNSIYNGGRQKVRTAYGNGKPAADAQMTDDSRFPIGSQYTDLDDAEVFTKTAAGDNWVSSTGS